MQTRKTKNVVSFTRATIDKLKSQSKRTYFYDAKIPGLSICVTSAGSKSFYVLRRINEKMEFLRIGGYPEMTIEQARDEAERINGRIASGQNPAEQKRQSKSAGTLAEAFEAFMLLPTRTKAKRPRSEKTQHEYRLQFKAYLQPTLANRRLSEIKRSDVEACHNKLGESSGHYAANRTLALLKAIYNAAIEAGYPGQNPASRVRKFEEHSRERFLQADELPKFWEALEAEPSEKVRDFIALALFTGQRRGNVLAMKWADVNLDRGLWTIPQTKTGRHIVPLTAEALAILRRRQANIAAEPSEYVLPGLHGYDHLKDPMRAWREILKRAGIDNLRIHDLRRSLGSWQAKTGASLPIIGKTLGHSRPETTLIYGRLDHAPVRDAMQRATSAMAAARSTNSTTNT